MRPCRTKLLAQSVLQLALIIAAALSPALRAQTFTSSIAGTVTDPTGAGVPNAKVELRNMATSDVRNATTQGDGTYRFDNLNPGTYQLAVHAPGFKAYTQQNLILQAQVATSVNVALEVGSTTEEIQVTAAATLLDTETANTSYTMESRLVQNLPNATRNPLNFVFALAGTTNPPQNFGGRFQVLDQSTANFGLNGGRTGEAAILVDGAPAQAIDWGGLLVSPLQDSVQEQQVLVNTYDAQYERSGAGVVTLITRGGSNQFHGEAYDYLQNSFFNANCWSCNKYGSPRGNYKQNQFGGNIGGPLLKRWNLFFFGGYEGLRQPNSQNSGLLSVPTALERQGDFSQSFIPNPNGSGTIPVTLYNPFQTTPVTDATGTVVGYTRTPFSGNKIPSNLVNPIGQALANLYPLPNRAPTVPGTDIGNFFATGKGNTVSDKMDLRFDWAQNTAHRMFFRFSDRFRQGSINPCFFCNGADPGTNSTSAGWLAVLNDTVTPSPTWVINSFVSYGFWLEQQRLVGFGQLNAGSVGLNSSLFQAPVLPVVYADNYTQLSNNQDQADFHYARTTSTAQVNVTKELSRHTLKFGGNFDVMLISNFKDFPGSFSFSSSLTSCDPQTGGGPCLANNRQSNLSGNAIASLLLGTPASGGQSNGISPAMGVHIFGGYIQDQWRVTPKLTINAGLRYENQRPATERHDRQMYFDPNAPSPIAQQVAPALGRTVAGAFVYTNGDNRYLWPPDNKNFAPRMGIAYKVSDRLVARVGAGIFYLPASAMLSFDNPGQFYGFASTTPMIATTNNGYTPANTISNPFPGGLNAATGSSLGASTLIGDGLGQIWVNQPHPTPYSIHWSFDLQYRLGAHSVIEAGYTGVRGKKLLYGNPNLNLNQLNPQYLSLGSQLDQEVPNPFYGVAPEGSYLGSQPTIAYNQLLRPYPQYTDLTMTRSLPGAHSQFDALNIKYDHSFNAGLTLLTTYQWSKAMDNGPEDFLGWATGNQWRDYYNTNLDYNISTHDVPQSFATALVYDLPYGKGKRWGNDAPGIVQQTLGNWQVSSSVRLASGLPLYQVFWSYDNPLNNYGFPGFQLANALHAPSTTGNPDHWIDASAFGPPANNYALGNVAQRYTQIRERAERNVDLSVAKTFPVTERWRVQFRGEAFNLFNYAQYNLSPFNSYPLCVSCGDFGDLNSTENVPRLLQFSLKILF